MTTTFRERIEGMPVEWRNAVGAPGYRVSNTGLVTGPKGFVLKQQSNLKGYAILSIHVGPARVNVRVASMVAEAFIGPRPEGLHVAHLNGQKTDNRAENLAYVTPHENILHKYAHGTIQHGERAANHVLTTDQVIAIRACKLSDSQQAAIYGVSRHTIQKARTRVRWAHVPEGAVST